MKHVVRALAALAFALGLAGCQLGAHQATGIGGGPIPATGIGGGPIPAGGIGGGPIPGATHGP